ncbi:MAG TPA: (Na+)-NQR maturation NqrM [Steroidobacteraceae bacterium]|nr:(Na+)-NQR maturation NqrM [Steroidobacteraceae bacterium]
MTTFIAAFVLFALAVLGLALGVIAGREPLRGSCGGLRRITGSTEPCACETPCPRRRRELERQREREGR